MLDRELLESFRDETKSLLGELGGLVKALEKPQPSFPSAILEEFAQKIDRIMGAAQLLAVYDASNQGLSFIGELAALCKQIGYQAAKTNDMRVVSLCAAFWSDTVENIQNLIDHVDDPKKSEEFSSNVKVLLGRLKWLVQRLNEPT